MCLKIKSNGNGNGNGNGNSNGNSKSDGFPAEAGPTDARGLLVGLALAGKGPVHSPSISRRLPIDNSAVCPMTPTDRSHAPRGNAASDALRPAQDVLRATYPTRSVGTINNVCTALLLVGLALAGKRPTQAPSILRRAHRPFPG
jgi:hypothetical protein